MPRLRQDLERQTTSKVLAHRSQSHKIEMFQYFRINDATKENIQCNDYI